MSDNTVAENMVVLFNYTLTGPDGEVIDSSDDGEPLVYLHGGGNIVPGLESALEGKSVGDKVNVTVPAAEAYGDKAETTPQHVPRDAFPEGMPLLEGMPLIAEGPDGGQHHFFITEVGDEEIVIDTNHPLAGVDLTFDVEITRIRQATEDELAHGHPHGPDGTGGHHHAH